MKKYLYILYAFIVAHLSACTTNVQSVGEVIVERGTNCYSIMLQYSKGFKSTDLAYTAIAIAAFTAAFNLDLATIMDGVTMAPIAAFAWIGKDDSFVKLKSDDVAKLEADELPKYQDALAGDLLKREEAIATKIVELSEDSEANKEEIQNLKNELMDSNKETLTLVKGLIETVREQGKHLGKMADAGEISHSTFKTAMKAAWDEKVDAIKEAHDSKKNIDITVKATQTYGDIDAGLDFAQMKPGVNDLPVRRPLIRDLFSTIPLSTEFLKYTEQDTVVRNAQNVAKCAAVTSTTKETLKVSSIETKVIKDQIDFCRLFINDYPFMESRINRLINQSIALRVDSQLLLGDGTGENTFSIDSVASTFDAANAVADIEFSVQAPTLVDLLLGMETQIIELGEQGDFVPNIAIVNKVDWFIQVQSRKDQNDNYLDGRVTMVGGRPMVGNMAIMWTTIMPQNEVYVFDSTKGEVVDRQELVIEIAFENKDNWEKQIASLQGYVRLNFLVEDNNANAFMHAPDVTAALTAITKP